MSQSFPTFHRINLLIKNNAVYAAESFPGVGLVRLSVKRIQLLVTLQWCLQHEPSM